MRKIFVLSILLICISFGAAYASSCVTDKCHSKIGKERYVHGPVAVGECAACHEKTGEHKFKPITNVKGLCAKCHDSKTGFHKGSKSVAANNFECGNCHDAHQSMYSPMLLAHKN